MFLKELPGSISGSVVIFGTTTAIEDATVSVELVSTIYDFQSSAETDVDGNFSLEQLPVGNYTLTASAVGYDPYLHGVEIGVTAGTITEDVDIGLTAE